MLTCTRAARLAEHRLLATTIEGKSSPPAMVANKGSRHGKHADLDRRRAYMRDYMRRRRAT